MTQIQSDEGRLLLRQIAALEDTIISQKKMLSDILYNLDSDNVPELRKISRIISDNGEQMSEIIQEVDSITLRVSDAEVGIGELQLTANSFDVRLLKTEGDIDDMPSTIEAVISSEINDTGGIIQAYVEGKNFITQEGADGLYTKISNLNAGIEAYIDSESGMVKVTQAVSGTYQKIDQMDNYVLDANLNAGIETYIDSAAGKVGITSAVSGTYQRVDQMGNYVLNESLNAGIETYIDSEAGRVGITSAVSGTYQRIDQMGNYVLNESLNAGIETYIDSEAGRVGITSAVSGTYQRIDQMGNYVLNESLNAGIETYIDSEAGRVGITSAVSGTYQRVDQMGNYVLNANLNSGISSYIDSEAGRVGINSAVSGTYQRIDQMGNYATTQNVAAIEQTVTQHGSQISLVVGSGRVVDGSGNVNGSIVISAINGTGSQALINFDKINITGVTTFLKASDVGAGGQTVIDGGRITTGAISAERISRVTGTSYIHLSSLTAVQSILAIGHSFTHDNFKAAQLQYDANRALMIKNQGYYVEVQSSGFRYNGYDVLTTANLVAQ